MNLWPEDISYTDLRSPITMLKEQASLLGDRTKNLVKAEVENASMLDMYLQKKKLGVNPNVERDIKKFAYDFNIVAPALQNYKYRLFSISFDIGLYPVEFYVDEDIKNQLYPEVGVPVANSEPEFREMLREIFNSQRSKRIIHTLIAQSGGLS